jgi:acetylornithine aminotransferase/acetylornithine/N-succinyldiaminopimelate aminotransferase
VRSRSELWHAALRQLVADFPARLTAFRGQGYLVGLQLTTEPGPTVAALREHGLLAPMAGGNVIRLLPPLTATTDELEAAVKILREVFNAAV